MPLQFFGREAGFGKFHNSAFFETPERELVVIDCPENTNQILKTMNLKSYNAIFIFITHTHDDHKSGLGIFIQYAYYVLNLRINIIAPNFEVGCDIIENLRIAGIENNMYDITSSDSLKEDPSYRRWFKTEILTEHVPQLKNRCFGYQFKIDGVNCVYTGDTCTLDPFMGYIEPGTKLYVDTSVFGGVHLKLDDCLEKYIQLSNTGVEVYLMHLDDILKIEEAIDGYSGIKLAPLADISKENCLSSFTVDELKNEILKRENNN